MLALMFNLVADKVDAGDQGDDDRDIDEEAPAGAEAEGAVEDVLRGRRAFDWCRYRILRGRQRLERCGVGR